MRQSHYISTIIAYLVFSTIGWLISLAIASPIIFIMGLLVNFAHIPDSETLKLYIAFVPPLPVLACVLMYFTAAPQDIHHVQRLFLLSLIFFGVGCLITMLYTRIPYVEDGPSGLYVLRHVIPAWGASFFFGLATLTALRAIRSPESADEKAKRSV